MDVAELDGILLAGAAVLLVAVVAVRLSARIGLPSLLIYLGMGLLLGESGPGHIHFEDAQLAHALGFAALVVILTEGGLTTRWNEVRPVMPLGLVLATVGVAVSVGVVACVAHFVLGLSWQLSVLLGAVTSPTDAAAVFAVLRRVPIQPRLRGALEAESGLNDAPTVLLVTLVSTGEIGDKGLLWFSGLVVYELVVGALFGLLIGWLSVGLIRRMALGSAGLYPLAVLSVAFISYAGGAVLLHVSGFAAVYVTSLVLGRAELPHRMATRSFVDGIAWLAQIGLFVMLGLLASPGDFELNDVLVALVIGVAVTVVGRFASVAVSAAPFRLPWAEQTFIAWAGLRGAVPIVLATIRWLRAYRRRTGSSTWCSCWCCCSRCCRGRRCRGWRSGSTCSTRTRRTRWTSTWRRWSRSARTCSRCSSRASPGWRASRSASSGYHPVSRSRW